MKYAVAYMDLFENDLKLVVIDRRDPITAIHDVAEEIIGPSKWLDDLCQSIVTREDWSEQTMQRKTKGQIERIIEEFFDADSVVAVLRV